MSTTKAKLVRRLEAATGLSREGVYKALREDREPHNPLIAKIWRDIISEAEPSAKPRPTPLSVGQAPKVSSNARLHAPRRTVRGAR